MNGNSPPLSKTHHWEWTQRCLYPWVFTRCKVSGLHGKRNSSSSSSISEVKANTQLKNTVIMCVCLDGGECGHLLAASRLSWGSSAKWMWRFWLLLHGQARRNSLPVINASYNVSAHAPPPVSFSPLTQPLLWLTEAAHHCRRTDPWRIRAEDGWLSRAPRAHGRITTFSVNGAAEKWRDSRRLATVNSCLSSPPAFSFLSPNLTANIGTSVTEEKQKTKKEKWQRWKKRADLRKIKEAENQHTRWKGK